MSDADQKRIVVRWAPRVSTALIRRLYASDAKGIQDEDLVNELGYALYARCRSILRATSAHNGTVECPGCVGAVPHRFGEEETLRCSECGWEMRWRSYRATYHGQRLLAGGAAEAFTGYLRQFEIAAGYRDKIMAIDRLIHNFHRDARGNATAPAARNVIDANVGEVFELLDGLASEGSSDSGLTESHAAFRATVQQAQGRGHLRR